MRPSFDRIEQRLALSALGTALPPVDTAQTGPSAQTETSPRSQLATVVQADPAPASVVEVSPSSLTITFARSFDSFTVANDDFTLVRVNQDGTTSPRSRSEARLGEAADPGDPSSTRIILTPSQALTDGHYRLLLLGSNHLLAADQTPLSPGGRDLVVTDFTIGKPSGGLASAIDLGVVTTTEAVHTDSLDLASRPGSFQLYKVTLPPGHHWRLGLEVSTPAGADRLSSVLSLFDDQGHLIDFESQGRPASPSDPYLFAGLSPGTYYVGVSGNQDVPGTAGGYDPVTGAKGTVGDTQPGGSFQLHLVADPADQATQVLGLRVDRSDSPSSTPAGLTVQFSGAIREARLGDPARPALVVVDSTGQTWAVTATDYDESRSLLSVVFDQALPAGHYTLQVPQGGGLLDLAGLVPTSPGNPPRVLGAFTIGQARPSPDDLGPIFLGIGSKGVSATIETAVGGSSVQAFEVLEPGFYSVEVAGATTGLRTSLADAQGKGQILDPAEVYLKPGVYTLTAMNSGNLAFTGTVTVAPKQAGQSSLVVGGVAQGPALNLRLVAPTPSLGQGGQGSTPSASSDTSIATASAAPDRSESGVNPQPYQSASTSNDPASSSGFARAAVEVVGASTASPSGLTSGVISLGVGSPVGRPSPSSQQISVVGPSGSSDSVALAWNQESLPAGLALSSRRAGVARSRPDGSPPDDPSDEAASAPDKPEAEADYGLISRELAHGVDDRILDDADWIDRFAARTLGRLEFLAHEDSPAGSATDDGMAEGSTAGAAPPAGDLVAIPGEPKVEVATIATPVGLGVLTVLAYRYRNRISIQLRGSGTSTNPAIRGPRLQGPHRRNEVVS